LSENKAVNKLLVAVFLLMVACPLRGQTPPPSFPSGTDASGAPSPASPPAQQVDPEKERLIRQVMAHTKEAEQAQERVLQAMAGMKLMMPRVPENVWEKYRQLISLDEFRNRLIYVYDKHYTSEELSELLKFYDSPLGKKMSDEVIPILRESMEIAQGLSKRAAQSVSSDFQAEELLQRPRAAGSLGPAIPSSGSAGPSAPTPTATAAP
jgi:uncharacterized protein